MTGTVERNSAKWLVYFARRSPLASLKHSFDR